MENKKKLTLKILVLLISTDFLETAAQFFFKKTALFQSDFGIKSLSDVFIFAKTAFFNPWLWLGFASVLLIFIIWSTVLSKIDLSVAVPVASFSYIFVPLASLIWLHEKIPLIRWIGIILILIGVILVSKSSEEKVKPNNEL